MRCSRIGGRSRAAGSSKHWDLLAFKGSVPYSVWPEADSMRKALASFAIFLMAVAAIVRGFAIPVVHAHEHMPLAPVSANSDAAALGTDCDPASHAAATDTAVDAACADMTHEHPSEKSKEHTAKVCSGSGACCGVLLTVDTRKSAAPDKYMPESVRALVLAGVQPAGLDRPPSFNSI